MKESVSYYYGDDQNIEVVIYKNSLRSYHVHTHADHYTVGVIQNGTIEIINNGTVTTCSNGEYFVISPDTAHSFRAIDSSAYDMISICIKADYLFNNDFESIINVLNSLLERLKTGMTDQINDALIVLYAGLTGVSDNTRRTYSEEIKRQLMLSPENPLSVEDMSQNVCVSPYHMIRQFKTEMGLTPHQFQIQSRIRKAQKMLQEGLTVTEVAFNTGFCDQSHFDRCFKRIVGIAPNEYRKSIL